MRQYLAESGLQITLEELYSDFQDVLEHNLEGYLKAIIQDPGLRIADGDEFLLRFENGQLVIRLGSVIFDDYTLFVPPTSQTQLSVAMPFDQITAGVTQLVAYLVSTAAYSHPYHVTGERSYRYAVGHSAVQLVIQDDTTPPPAHSWKLAQIEVLDTDYVITDCRLESQLTMIGDYTSRDWDPQVGIAPQAQKVSAISRSLYDARKVQIEGASGSAAVNRHSLFTDVRENYVVDVSWDMPPAAELNALRGLVYYKVLAIPTLLGEEQLLPIQAIVPALPSSGDRCGCLIPITPGCTYSITVCRVSNLFHHRISTPTSAIVVEVPRPFSCMSCVDVILETSRAYSTRDLIQVRPLYEYSRNSLFRLFAREYTDAEGPWSDSTDVVAERFLVHEGPIDTINYMVVDWDTNAGVTFVGQIIGAGNQLISTSQPTPHPFDKGLVNWDQMVVVYAPEFTGVANAWPPKLPAQYLLNQFDLGTNARLVAAMTGFVQGSLSDRALWRTLDPNQTTDHTAAILVQEMGSGTAYSWETDGYGYSSVVFTDNITLNEDTQVVIQRGVGGDAINPSGLYIVLYFKYEE